MTDKEKACKACCGTTPCKKLCNYARCYMAGLAEGRKENEELAKRITELQADKGKLIDELESWKQFAFKCRENC